MENKSDKRDVQLFSKRIGEANAIRNYWVVTSEFGTTREDLLKPSYWSNVAVRFKPFDRIEVRTDDGSYFAEYIVISCDRTWANVKELNFIYLTDQENKPTDEHEEFEYKYRGPYGKHSIVRKSDGSVLTEKHETQDEARAWLKDYKKTIAA